MAWRAIAGVLILPAVLAACERGVHRGPQGQAAVGLEPGLSPVIEVYPSDARAYSSWLDAWLVPLPDGTLAFMAAQLDAGYLGRVTADGAPLDPVRTFLPRGGSVGWSAYAVVDGAGLLAWSEQPDSRGAPARLQLVRADPGGRELEPLGELSAEGDAVSGLTFAGGAGGFLLAWGTESDGRDPQRLWGTPVTAVGPSAPPTVLFEREFGSLLHAPLAASGDADFAVVFHQPGGVRLARLDVRGRMLDVETLAVQAGWHPRIWRDGEGYVVSMDEPAPGAPCCDFPGDTGTVVRLSAGLEVLPPGPVHVPGSSDGGWRGPTVVPSDSGYLLFHDGNLLGSDVLSAEWRTRELQPRGEPFVLADARGAGSAWLQSAASVPGGIVLTYGSYAEEPTRAPILAFVPEGGEVAWRRPLFEVGAGQRRPSAASDGGAFLVTWRDDRLGPQGMASRVSATEGVDAGEGRGFDSRYTEAWERGPHASWQGQTYVIYEVVWESGRSLLREIQLARDGRDLGSRSIPVDLGVFREAVLGVAGVETGSRLAVLAPIPTQTSPVALRTVLLGADGAVRADRTHALPGVWPPELVAVAGSGASHLVVYELYVAGGGIELQALVLNGAGDPVAPPGVLGAVGIGLWPQAAAAAVEDSYLVAWTDRTRDPEGDLRAASVAVTGGTLDMEQLDVAAGAGIQQDPAVAWDGRDAWVAWTEAPPGAPPAVRIARVGGRAGRAVLPRTVSPAERACRRPALAANRQAEVLLAFECFDDSPDVLNWRVYARVLSRSADGVACGHPDECASHNCVDGVCCNQPCSGGDVDCLACSVAGGAPEDGTCAALADGAACRGGTACVSAGTCAEGLCACAAAGGGAGAPDGGAGGVGAAQGGRASGGADASGCGCGGSAEPSLALLALACLAVACSRPGRGFRRAPAGGAVSPVPRTAMGVLAASAALLGACARDERVPHSPVVPGHGARALMPELSEEVWVAPSVDPGSYRTGAPAPAGAAAPRTERGPS